MTAAAWNTVGLLAAVNGIIGSDTAAVSWADADGEAVSRAGGRKPPRLVVGACVRGGDEQLEQIRALPGFVRLTAREERDIDDEPYKAVRAVFKREHEEVRRGR